ncbi:acyl-CoA dehydrogenase [Celeribacter persicus]|uniref:Alkylation response protein AidB-like acyl-CoA dehydrogenase n=1 Tax=Celeribacter persicus TaxID=1651082 RepID=A0A2T5H4H2_9RHOB|nr:acyl-CoA dehydrogenase [Celeribacter persicus]PTQ66472.1 alkylation response protein AidB-like acyl-CoA dehydrogenase [Celeribacter persicus]
MMDFELNDTERMLCDTLDRFAMTAPSETGTHWQHCVDMGWHIASVSEELGGFDLGLNGPVLVARSLGGMLSPVDWAREAVLPALLLTGLSLKEPRAVQALEGFLTGTLRVVVAVADAKNRVVLPAALPVDLLLVLTEEGTRVLWQEQPEMTGVEKKSVDGEQTVSIRLSEASGQALSKDLTDRLRTAAHVVAAADRLGAMEKAFAMTLDYCRTRHQFGRPLSGFQALQHRLVDMFIACDETEALVLAAAMAATGERSDAMRLATAAWTRACDLGQSLGEEAIQLHGGIGMTEECDVGRYVKRMMARRPVL